MTTFDFSSKAALVTGASRGIGRAVAVRLARGGARVAVHHHANPSGAEATLAELDGSGHIAVQADITDPAAVADTVETVIDRLDALDVLVNNAGVYEPHPLHIVSYDQWQAVWRRTIDTNLIGAANVTYCAARFMLAHDGGRIVNVSSRGAFRGEPDHPAYGASKAALNSLGQSLAQSLGPRIRVATVAPGFVDTDMAAPYLRGSAGDAIRAQSPLGRAATPDEVAYVVAFLASDGAELTTGAIVDVNGASHLRS